MRKGRVSADQERNEVRVNLPRGFGGGIVSVSSLKDSSSMLRGGWVSQSIGPMVGVIPRLTVSSRSSSRAVYHSRRRISQSKALILDERRDGSR